MKNSSVQSIAKKERNKETEIDGKSEKKGPEYEHTHTHRVRESEERKGIELEKKSFTCNAIIFESIICVCFFFGWLLLLCVFAHFLLVFTFVKFARWISGNRQQWCRCGRGDRRDTRKVTWSKQYLHDVVHIWIATKTSSMIKRNFNQIPSLFCYLCIVSHNDVCLLFVQMPFALDSSYHASRCYCFGSWNEIE